MKLSAKVFTALILTAVFSPAAQASFVCPDSKIVEEGPCQVCPDGSYVGSGNKCPPTSTGPAPEIIGRPSGKNYPGGRPTMVCPDGTVVLGTRCVITPDGSYIGQ